MRSAWRLRVAVAFALATMAMGGGTVAWATMTDGDSASLSISTGTLEPATEPATAAGTCVAAVGDSIVLAWTRTPSDKADGYEILRAVGTGPYSSHALVSGRTTESFTDTLLEFSTEYSYIVKAKKESWRSAGTTPVSRTTKSILCV